MLGTMRQAGKVWPENRGLPCYYRNVTARTCRYPQLTTVSLGQRQRLRLARSRRVSLVPEQHTSARLSPARVLKGEGGFGPHANDRQAASSRRQWLLNHWLHHTEDSPALPTHDLLTPWPAYLPISASLSGHFRKEIKRC